MYGIRQLDNTRVKQLEDQLIKSKHFRSKLSAIIDTDSIDHLSNETVNAYKFFVISGNHRRMALQNILAQGLLTDVKTVTVDVYFGICL